MDDRSFFSIDRLVEFGLGISFAQQMVNVMNQSMQSMYIPGSVQSIPQLQPRVYYVAINGQQIGPLNDSELSHLILQKKISKDTLSWTPGMTAWEPIERVPEILKIIALTPPPMPEKR